MLEEGLKDAKVGLAFRLCGGESRRQEAVAAGMAVAVTIKGRRKPGLEIGISMQMSIVLSKELVLHAGRG